MIAKYDAGAGKITVTGKGEKQYPFVFRHDIGRVVAKTLSEPARFKDAWVVTPAHWISGNELAQLIQETTGRRDLAVEHVEPSAKTPVILFLEQTGGNVFDRSLEAKDLGLQFEDFVEYAKSWVR